MSEAERWDPELRGLLEDKVRDPAQGEMRCSQMGLRTQPQMMEQAGAVALIVIAARAAVTAQPGELAMTATGPCEEPMPQAATKQ